MAELIGTETNDTLYGSPSNDSLNGKEADDTLYGNCGYDTLVGELGKDSLDGGLGNDLIYGGFWDYNYDNSYWQSFESEPDTVEEDLGNDTTTSATINEPTTPVGDTLGGGTGDDTSTGGNQTDPPSPPLDDPSPNIINGGFLDFFGHRLDYGSSGSDSIEGGVSDDWLYGSGGSDSIDGGDGDDLIDATSNDNTNSTLIGGNGNDQLFGGNGKDSLEGGAGSDLLSSGTGNNTLNGGSGNDLYEVESLNTTIIETSTLKTEQDSVISYVNYSLAANLESLTLLGDAVKGTGNELDNTIEGNVKNNILDGGQGNDSIVGGDIEKDFDYPYKRSDSAYPCVMPIWTSAPSNDTLIGGEGDDTLYAGSGNNLLQGGSGNDTYIVSSASDVVSETSTLPTEIDTVQSNANYTLGANLENLTLNDSIPGSTSSDDGFDLEEADHYQLIDDVYTYVPPQVPGLTATGNDLNNTITGGDLNNLLQGKSGNDTLIDNLGNDTLSGYGGQQGEKDILTGGDNNDLFVLGDASGVFYNGDGNEGFGVITDLTTNDKIQLKGTTADYVLDKTQNFAGTGSLDTAIFTQAGDLIGVIQDNTSLLASLNSPLFSFV